MKIWITGAAGFLGRRISQQLLADQHEVIAISRRETDHATRSNSIDLADRTALSKLSSLIETSGPPDIVIHTASRQPGLKGELVDYVKSNVTSTSNLLAALEPAPPKQFICTSTLTVYGRTTRNPVSEDSPAGGTLPYSATKRWAEQLIERAATLPKRVILRLPSLFGNGQEDSFIDGLARLAVKNQNLELFGRGELVRDALHVSDVVTAVQNCLQNPPQSDFVCMNLGCGRAVTTHEWASALVDALGSQSSIEPIDQSTPQFDLYANIELARRTIGFCPTDLRESMKRYAAELRT